MTTPLPRMLRLREVQAITGLGHDTIYRLERENSFPRRRKLTPRSTAWREDEIRAWLDSRPTATATGPAVAPKRSAPKGTS